MCCACQGLQSSTGQPLGDFYLEEFEIQREDGWIGVGILFNLVFFAIILAVSAVRGCAAPLAVTKRACWPSLVLMLLGLGCVAGARVHRWLSSGCGGPVSPAPSGTRSPTRPCLWMCRKPPKSRPSRSFRQPLRSTTSGQPSDWIGGAANVRASLHGPYSVHRVAEPPCSYTVKTADRPLLTGVTGRAAPGRMLALMGASGGACSVITLLWHGSRQALARPSYRS